ncbi:MAG: DMT family transporter [Marinilabiliales bacterium]
MKKGLQSYSSYQVAEMRIFFSFLILLPFMHKAIKKINRKNIGYILITGFIGNMIPAFFYTTAQLKINSSLAGMLNSLTPIFTLIVGLLLFRVKTGWLSIIGIFIGLIGASGLAIKDFSTFFEKDNWYALFAVAATVCYGLNTNVIKEKLGDLSGLEITALSFLFTGPISGIMLFFSDLKTSMQTENYLINLMFVFLLALFSSVLAVIGMNILLKYVSALFVASVTYIIPIFAIMWGIFDGEKIYLIDIFWIILIFIGVYLINSKRKKLNYEH